MLFLLFHPQATRGGEERERESERAEQSFPPHPATAVRKIWFAPLASFGRVAVPFFSLASLWPFKCHASSLSLLQCVTVSRALNVLTPNGVHLYSIVNCLSLSLSLSLFLLLCLLVLFIGDGISTEHCKCPYLVQSIGLSVDGVAIQADDTIRENSERNKFCRLFAHIWPLFCESKSSSSSFALASLPSTFLLFFFFFTVSLILNSLLHSAMPLGDLCFLLFSFSSLHIFHSSSSLYFSCSFFFFSSSSAFLLSFLLSILSCHCV